MKLTIPRMKRDITTNHTDFLVIVFVLLFVFGCAVARGILVHRSGIEPGPMTVKVQRFNPWIA